MTARAGATRRCALAAAAAALLRVGGRAAADPAEASPLGLRFTGSPPGARLRAASLIGEHAGDAYALHHVERGGGEELGLARRVARDERGRAEFEVVAALALPAPADGCVLVFGAGACRLAGRDDPEVVARLATGDGEWLDAADHAWRADRGGRRFEPLSAASVVCHNPDFGAGAP
jgi:hypothetical protein